MILCDRVCVFLCYAGLCFTCVLYLCRRAIRAAFRNCGRGAILTTHYMEEAEAVCDRVAIVVSGQLRFILTAGSHSSLHPGSTE